MKRTLHLARTAAQKNAIVLLLGESGAGKDHIAKFIHDTSKRCGGPYFSVNCAAIAPQLAESELFGHERGAFTGAQGRKRGLLELAEGGTLLLNEIGELPVPLQAKLLTFLDTRRFTRVGGEKEISVDARLLVATNRNLAEEVEAGRFRQDLFYRINVFSICVPPLRERREDIPVLVQGLISRLRNELRISSPSVIDPKSMELLKRYDWPGNVRELRNVLERAMILSDGKPLKFVGLGITSGSGEQDEEGWAFTAPFPVTRTLNEVAQDLKRSFVIEALRRTNGNKQAASRLLGISRYSMKHYMKTLGIADATENE
jgi:two-component system response regulator AtoC